LREPIEDDPAGPRYRTQARWIERGARLLGLSGTLEDRAAERIAEELELLGLEHHALRQRFRRSGRLEERGTVLSELLLLPLDGMLWARLLAAGHLASVWKAPKLWVPQLGQSLSPFSRSVRAMRAPP
jgi:hypothetical protein